MSLIIERYSAVVILLIVAVVVYFYIVRRTPNAQPSFPVPKWPPIQKLDDIDITGKRNDGGVDLVIVASQPIDDSPATLDCIRKKVATYLDTIDMEAFQRDMGHPPRDKTAILIFCKDPIHPSAMAVIEECRTIAEKRGIQLAVREKPN